MTDKFTRTHGSTGTQPPDGKEFQQDERPDESYFDWFWYNVHEKINSLIDEVDAVVNGTTTVGEASNADTVDGEHASAFADSVHSHAHSEITNVGSSDHHTRYADSEAVSAVNAEASLSVDISGDADTLDGNHYSDIQTWVNNNADVPNADYADSAGNADTLDGNHASAFSDSGHLHDSRYVLESGDTMSGDLTVNSSIQVNGHFVNASVATASDLPTGLPEGTQIYVEDENKIYVEDGT